MMSVRTFVGVAAAMWTFGCAHGGPITSRPLTVNTPRYVTFFVLNGTSSGSTVVDDRIHSAIEMTFADKGLIEAAPDEGQAAVVVHVASADKRSRDAFYAGWGGWGWRADGAANVNAVETYSAGTVVVDIFDAWSKQLVWHGVAPDAVPTTGTLNARKIEDPVISMFRTFVSPIAAADAGTKLMAEEETRIIFSATPASLILVDGEPEYRKVDDKDLQRVVNSRALILRDEGGLHYLRIGHRWMEADTLAGWWSIAGAVPGHSERVLKQAADENGVDLLDGESAEANVYISTTPAVLVVTDGEPQFATVDGTNLLRVTNTAVNVFKEPTDQALYVAASERWYRAWTTNGPWQYVPNADLPTDLAKFTSERRHQPPSIPSGNRARPVVPRSADVTSR